MALQIKIKKLTDTSKTPTYAHETGDACFDLYADTINLKPYYQGKIVIAPHCHAKIPTGIAMQPSEGYVGLMFSRSSMGAKKQLRLANCTAIMDESYLGEWIVVVHNDSDTESQIIEHGDRIAQAMFIPVEKCEFIEVNKLENTERGTGGFGSTGT